jgi:hypothetical protein
MPDASAAGQRRLLFEAHVVLAKKSKSWIKWIGGIALILLLGLPALLWGLLATGWLTPAVNQQLAAHLKGVLAGEVRFGRVSTNLFTRLTIRDMLILSNQSGFKMPVATVEKVTIRFSLWKLLRGKVRPLDDIELVYVEGLKLFVLRDTEGVLNLTHFVKPESLRPHPNNPSSAESAMLPKTRLVISGAVLVFNDQERGFHATIEDVSGWADTLQAPLLRVALVGRTEGEDGSNLQMGGTVNLAQKSLKATVRLTQVSLAQYLNYAIRGRGARFLGGVADLDLQVTAGAKQLDLAGKAVIQRGVASLQGLAHPLKNLHGRVEFSGDRIQVKELKAQVLGSEWTAGGSLNDLDGHPSMELFLSNPSLDLAAMGGELKALTRTALTGQVSMGLSLTGEVKDPVANGWMNAAVLSVFEQDLDSFSARIKYAQGRLELTQLQSHLWEGDLGGQGSLIFPKTKNEDGELSFVLKLNDAGLATVLGRWKNTVPVDGQADGELHLSGTFKNPHLEYSVRIGQSMLAGREMGPLSLQGSLADKQFGLNVKGWPKDGEDQLEGRIILLLRKEPWISECWFTLKKFDLKALASAMARHGSERLPKNVRNALEIVSDYFSGLLDARLEGQGSLQDPQLTLDFDLPDGKAMVHSSFASSKANEALDVRFKGRLISNRDAISLSGIGEEEAGLSVLSHGHGVKSKIKGIYHFSDRNQSNLSLDATADLQVLQALDLFENSQGTLSSSLRLRFQSGVPQLEGGVLVTGVNAKLNRYVSEIKSGHLSLAFNNSGVEVKECFFRSGGTVQGAGRLGIGMDGLTGLISLRTGDGGVRIDRWDDVAHGFLELDPLSVEFAGLSSPMRIKGRVYVHDTTLSWNGGQKPGVSSTVKPALILNPEFDLRLGLGERVWYRRGVDEGLPDINLDVARSVQQLVDSYEQAFRRPTFFVQLKPTQQDLKIQGPLNDLSLSGALEIQRGVMNLMHNDFNILKGAVVFRGSAGASRNKRRRGDLTAEAETKVSTSSKPGQPSQNYVITVRANPMTDSQLEALHWEQVFLNYYLAFTCDPSLTQSGNGVSAENDREMNAIAALLVLGEDFGLAQQASSGSQKSGSMDAGSLLAKQAFRYLGTMTSRFFAKGYTGMAGTLLDYFRFTPRFEVLGSLSDSSQSSEGATGTEGAPASTPSGNRASGQTGSLRFKDVSMEVGKSLTRELYLTAQGIYFNQSEGSRIRQQGAQEPMATQNPYGARVGLEYFLGRNRQLVGYVNYNVDDRLEPRVVRMGQENREIGFYLGVRGSIPVDTYSRSTMMKRRKLKENPAPRSAP